MQRNKGLSGTQILLWTTFGVGTGLLPFLINSIAIVLRNRFEKKRSL